MSFTTALHSYRPMDINYLFFRQQVERSRAKTATSDISRNIHAQLAGEYERKIEELTNGRVVFVGGNAQRAAAD